MRIINRGLVVCIGFISIIFSLSFKVKDTKMVIYYQSMRYAMVYNNEFLYTADNNQKWGFHSVYERNRDARIGVENLYFVGDSSGIRFRINYFSFRYRDGKVIKGKQEGEWITKDKSLENKNYICRIENFKNGIREGVYLIFNKEGDTLYSTTFVNGKGVEKDYYPNGQLYYHGTKDAGYFTDTLTIYRPDGLLLRKTLYHPNNTKKAYEIGYGYHENKKLSIIKVEKDNNDTISITSLYRLGGELFTVEKKLKNGTVYREEYLDIAKDYYDKLRSDPNVIRIDMTKNKVEGN